MAKRRNKVIGIDEKAFGQEPVFNPGETPTEPRARSAAYGWASGWYNYNCKTKDHRPYILQYAKEELKFSKDKLSKLKRHKDYDLSGYLGHPIRVFYRGWEFTKQELKSFKDEYARLLDLANELEDVKEDVKVETQQPKISPRQRLIDKVNDTIGNDWDDLLESWMSGDYTQGFDTFKLFKVYDLKSPAISIVYDMVYSTYEEITDAYNKKCEQAVEAYSHVSRSHLRKCVKILENIISDLESLKSSLKATRAPRVKKPKASEKQVEKLNYSKESMDYKLSSINPVMIPGSTRLYLFNTKTKKLTELVSETGFEVSGSSIKKFDPDKSRTITLRKPTDVLPIVLSKTPNQINKMWDTLTTKTAAANGRVNADTILLRALNK